MREQDKPTTPEGDGENAIQAALRRGISDDEIVASIIEHTRVTEGDAWQILARAKGENVDDVVDVDDPSFPQPTRPLVIHRDASDADWIKGDRIRRGDDGALYVRDLSEPGGTRRVELGTDEWRELGGVEDER